MVGTQIKARHTQASLLPRNDEDLQGINPLIARFELETLKIL